MSVEEDRHGHVPAVALRRPRARTITVIDPDDRDLCYLNNNSSTPDNDTTGAHKPHTPAPTRHIEGNPYLIPPEPHSSTGLTRVLGDHDEPRDLKGRSPTPPPSASSISDDKDMFIKPTAADLESRTWYMPDSQPRVTERQFNVPNNPFRYTPGQLNKMLNPKSLAAFHALGGLAGIEKGLRTDRHTGLSSDDLDVEPLDRESGMGEGWSSFFNARAGRSSTRENDLHLRTKVFGQNRLPPPREKPLYKLMWEAWNDKLLILLTLAAVVSLSLGLYQSVLPPDKDGSPSMDWVEGVAILIAVLIVVVTGALNDWQKERQFRKLNRKKEDRQVKVVRSGKPTAISVYDILVGDVLFLEPGDLVPVDGIFIEGHGIKCDESSVTGESDHIKKTPGHDVKCDESSASAALDDPFILFKCGSKVVDDPFILSGSKVVEGLGTVLVTAVGANTQYSQMLLTLREHRLMWTLGSESKSFMQNAEEWLGHLLYSLAVWVDDTTERIGQCLAPFLWSFLAHIFHDIDQLLYGLCLILGTLNSSPIRPAALDLTPVPSGNPPQSHEGTFWDGVVLKTHFLPSFASFTKPEPASIPVLWLANHNPTTRGLNLLGGYQSKALSHRKLAMGLLLTTHGIPLAAAALMLTRGFRIASGATASISGVTVIPLRTTEGFPVWSWILTYGVWAAAFSVYLWLQTLRIPPEVNNRRQLYLFCVIMAAVHFTIAISQGSTSIPDAFTLYGPILLTASAFLMSLLLKAISPKGYTAAAQAGGQTTTLPPGANATRPDGTTVTLAAAAMGGFAP